MQATLACKRASSACQPEAGNRTIIDTILALNLPHQLVKHLQLTPGDIPYLHACRNPLDQDVWKLLFISH
jgi:hypothetical protein